MLNRPIPVFALFTAILTTASTGFAQANLSIYTDNLVNGFQNWSWATVNLQTNSPVHSGNYSISVTDSTNYQALYLEHSDFNTTPYASLNFWINGGTSGGQKVQVWGVLDGTNQVAYSLGTLPANTWQQFTIPLASLGVANKATFSGIWIQGNVATAQPTFYVDDIQLVAAPAPALTHLNVDATQTIRPADARWFGVNTAIWDGDLGNSQTLPLVQQAGCLALRWPGGSTSDTYHWAAAANRAGNTNFYYLATNLGAQVFITANYGSGSSNEAAAWVKSANITNNCGFKYWEIGNECYGTWENDTNRPAHDPYTYAVRAAGYIAAMKAADPTIRVGVVVTPGEDSYSNNAAHPVVNPRTGKTHYGWTPVMLTTLKNSGVTPDFAIYHFYPEYTPTNWAPNSPDSDPLLLQVAANWASDAADLRQQISDYAGPAGTGIELVCTENNSDSGAGFGRQLTSIVNGLYLADSACQLMKTEFNAYLWWDLRNGPSSLGSFDPTLYGWRTYGDEGMINGASGLYPTFYAEKLLQYFVRPGDTVLNATSDYLLLSAYAARKADGALSLLVINKDATANFNAQISLSDFAPSSTSMTRSYGIAQDDAVRTNSITPGAQDIVTNVVPVGAVFTNSFPPYSLTLFTFAPAPAQLSALLPQPGQFILQLQGQPGTPYIIESSPDLSAWTPVSTNLLAGNVLSVTNAISPGTSQQFWRAVWQP
jgi:alpha-L-arabinofuranosidase